MDKSKIYQFFADRNNYNKVFKTCLFYSKSVQDAEDAVQDTYLRLQSMDDNRIPDEEPLLRAYVLRAARNSCFGKLRTDKQLVKALVPEDTDSVHGWEEPNVPAVHKKLDALHQLIMTHQDLFSGDMLKLWQCMYKFQTVEEIQRALGKTSPQRIYSLKNKLIARIRKNYTLDNLME